MIRHAKRLVHAHHHRLPYLVWVIALLSLAVSMAFSEVWKLAPCVLCWWQRILMFPMVVTAGVGILRRDDNWAYYTIPLSAIGTLVSAYHSLLQWGIIPEAVSPCQLGVSCITKQIELFGFVTIPFMAFLTFAAMTVTMAIYIWWHPAKSKSA